MDPENVAPPQIENNIDYKSNYSRRPVFIWFSAIFLALITMALRIPVKNVLTVLATGGLLGYTIHALINTKGKSVVIISLFVLNCLWFLFFVYMIFFMNGWHLNENAFVTYIVIALIYFIAYRLIYRGKTKKQS